MYLKLPGYTEDIIKGLYRVWVPPIPKDRHIIQGWELKKGDQIWRRQALPEFYTERREEESYLQSLEKELVLNGELDRVTHYDATLEKYRREQWQKRIHGHWVMINGEPTYLVGPHWMYLQWSKFDHPENDGYPNFYKPQIGRFRFRVLCKEDPFCLGYIFVGPRGYGKTSEEVAVIMDDITKPPHNRHVAIQSKSQADAEEVVFQEKMVPLFNAYPDFFKPTHSHGSNPKESMKFRRKTNTKNDQSKMKFGPLFELGNTIKAFNAKEKAIDGKSLASAYSTEIGKTHPREEADVYKRHGVHIKTVYRNNVKRGIIREETTVEEMDQGGDQCYEIWKESDPRERDPNGYTASKVYKYFVDGIDAGVKYADKFGNIDEEKARQEILNEREPFKDRPDKLSLIVRKNPLTEEEAFIKDQSKCMFNVFIINRAISELKQMDRRNDLPGRVGNLEWVGGKVDGDVEFVDIATGDFRVFYMPDPMRGERKILNACGYRMENRRDRDVKLWLPVNSDLYRGGNDPIKFIKTSDPRASKMAAHGFQNFDPLLDHGKENIMDWISHNLMWEYCNRHEDPEEDYENIIKALRFFGHHFMPEGNVSDFNKHLYGRGYEKFIIVRKNFDPSVLMQKSTKNALGADQAVHTNTEVIDSYVKFIKRFVNKYGLRIKSLPLLKQLLEFDSKNPTAYDLVVSFGYTLMSLEAELEDYSQNVGEIAYEFFNRYDTSGGRSILMPNNHIINPEDEGSRFDNEDFINHLKRGK